MTEPHREETRDLSQVSWIDMTDEERQQVLASAPPERWFAQLPPTSAVATQRQVRPGHRGKLDRLTWACGAMGCPRHPAPDEMCDGWRGHFVV